MLKFNLLERGNKEKNKPSLLERARATISVISMDNKISKIDFEIKYALRQIEEINKNISNKTFIEFHFKRFLVSVEKIEFLLISGGLIEDADKDLKELHEVIRRWQNGGYDTASLMLEEKIKPILARWQDTLREKMHKHP